MAGPLIIVLPVPWIIQRGVGGAEEPVPTLEQFVAGP
jgi:hypothetical protein